jgi:hypothetical protein
MKTITPSRLASIHRDYFKVSVTPPDQYVICKELAEFYDDDFLIYVMEKARRMNMSNFIDIEVLAKSLNWPLDPEPSFIPMKPVRDIIRSSNSPQIAADAFEHIFSLLNGKIGKEEWEKKSEEKYPGFGSCLDRGETTQQYEASLIAAQENLRAHPEQKVNDSAKGSTVFRSRQATVDEDHIRKKRAYGDSYDLPKHLEGDPRLQVGIY